MSDWCAPANLFSCGAEKSRECVTSLVSGALSNDDGFFPHSSVQPYRIIGEKLLPELFAEVSPAQQNWQNMLLHYREKTSPASRRFGFLD
jgi:hypothetical protein